MSEKWKTSISNIKSGDINIRGYNIVDMMEKLSFAESIFLLFKGSLPTSSESALLNAILVSTIDHGPTSPSALSSRVVASSGNSLNASVAAGVLAIGDWHGGAIEESAKILQEWGEKDGAAKATALNLIDWLSENEKKMPGFGHKLHESDPRTSKLFDLAEKHNCTGKHIKLCKALEIEFEAKLSKKIPININGATAAVISDLGFDWRVGKGIFIISRVPGLIAHYLEEQKREKPLRKLGPTPFEYDGPDEREI